ncbi:MAG: acetyl-CoA carboxylase biotin carboxylase subunit family protein [Oscillospiraceae bacterium]
MEFRKIETERPVAVVLGGTNPHIELIRQLQARGYFVVLADYLENPPAKSAADLHERVSTMDEQAVLDVAKKHQAKLVISACVDQANITACYVAEQLNLTKPYSYKTASEITNKGVMKQVMVAHGIPTTNYFYLEGGETLPDVTLRFPVMVKPADSCAASGVKKANNPEELKQFLKEAKQVSRTGRTVVEEFFSGVEVSAYCFVQDNHANVIMISERLSVIDGENQVLKCYATITPPNISDAAIEKIKEVSTKIANAFRLNNTPLHVQAIVAGDEISIIEFAPRVGGGISYQTIRDNTGFDIISATIDSYLEKKVELHYSEISYCYSVNLIYGIPSVFDHVEGAEKLMEEGIVEGIHYHKTKGMRVYADRASGGRIAAFLVKGANREEVCKKVAYAMEHMEAYDSDGNKIMRKDLYIKK